MDAVDDAYYVGAGLKRSSPIDYANTKYNKRGLFAWEQQMMDDHFTPGSALALLAAGGGREVLALRQQSFDVQAWECQPELVEAANSLLVAEGFEPTVSFAPRNTVPAGPAQFDGFIIGWGAYTLIPGRDRRVALLQAARTRVTAGSPLLVSFFNRRPGNVYDRIVAGFGNLWRRLLRRERLEVGESLEPNLVRAFVEEEIRSELAAGGFRMTYFSTTPYGHAVAVAD
ncbi:MAG: hypothetical protein Q4F67_07910 [Propionibacteriaceae bacterium]|nr:hypothetical protein [Propionibacteriaceae bacterium]